MLTHNRQQKEPFNTEQPGYGTMTTNKRKIMAYPILDKKLTINDKIQTNIKNKGASVLATVFNIIKNLIGSGILTLPWATANVGLVPFILLISLSFSVSFITWMLLVISAEHLNVYDFRDLAYKTYGNAFARFNDILLIIFPFFICILYSIFAGQFITEALTQYGINISNSLSNVHSFSEFIATNFFIVTICVFFIMFPLSLLPKLEYLKYSSLIGLIATFFTVGYIAYCFFINPIPNPTISYFKFESNTWYLFWLESFGIFTAAYFAHFNAASLYEELTDRSVSKMLKTSWISFVITALINFLMAIPAYLQFGQDTPQNIIAALSGNIVGVLRILMALMMIASYPFLFWNSKISLRNLIFFTSNGIRRKFQSKKTENLAYFLFTVCIWIVAVNVNGVGILLSFFVSLAGNMIVYIFPALIYLKVLKMQNKCSIPMSIMCYAIVCFGVICSFGGTISAILNFIGYD
eukprot:254007_1